MNLQHVWQTTIEEMLMVAISQKKDCYIYNLIMINSIDEWIDRLVSAKL